jgi:hypothetical protein
MPKDSAIWGSETVARQAMPIRLRPARSAKPPNKRTAPTTVVTSAALRVMVKSGTACCRWASAKLSP